jgi:hypothetical protein
VNTDIGKTSKMKNRPGQQRFNGATRILDANSRKNIQTRAEKTFKRLMLEFLAFLDGKDAQSKEVQDKIAELNTEWVEYCEKIIHINEGGKKEFMVHVNKVLEGLPALMKIEKAPEEAPAGTTSPEN